MCQSTGSEKHSAGHCEIYSFFSWRDRHFEDRVGPASLFSSHPDRTSGLSMAGLNIAKLQIYHEHAKTRQSTQHKYHGRRGNFLQRPANSASGSPALVPRYRGPTLIYLPKILRWCRTAGERSRQRKQLLEMDYRQLKDIGITRDQAEQQAHKPIWKD